MDAPAGGARRARPAPRRDAAFGWSPSVRAVLVSHCAGFAIAAARALGPRRARSILMALLLLLLMKLLLLLVARGEARPAARTRCRTHPLQGRGGRARRGYYHARPRP
eukprot:scaffold2262_cov312-Prasinococcus_capsulatus_cf.AAC.1